MSRPESHPAPGRTATHPSIDELRVIDLFDGLSDAELQRWADAAASRDVPAGATLLDEGEDSVGLILLLQGTIEALVSDGNSDEPVGDHVAPTWLGAIPTLMGGRSAIRMLAHNELHLAIIAPEAFTELVFAHRSVFRRIMAQVRPVVGRMTAREQNRERLASLGTMSAGLAHELNNPAAAAKRAADDLADTLQVLASTVGLLVESGIERDQAAELVALQREAVAAAAAHRRQPASSLSSLDAADAEEALADALAEAGLADAWRIAEPLAGAGIDEPFVTRVAGIAGPATDATLRWIAASLGARQLADELRESTERMSKLVKAVKTYAYMDRGELEEVDLHDGLETTLTVLGHKLKHTAIEVVRHYDRALPPVTVRGAELNQVWTNLLDNAIDALGESGTITITTRRDGGCVEVDIADDGPGVPKDIRGRLFDPFFTTKDVGKGTGLGLDAARRIVVDRHHGSLTLDSETGPPARTVFRVRVPIDGEQG